ncbi:hypothetical protein L1987_65418 [Smallanthus sonchifolius]|uniref:Uncharacterized protein n=1 Tax=Smallanthus sonchifolius TaxID=185202 RepID=A0ACB9BU98_9ASTR|nr:hypothetical protein L1987_65418 [Smallanthus sonchifolius]
MVKVNLPSREDFVKGGDRNKNAKQLTWVFLLKAHRATTSMASTTFSLSYAVHRRVTSGHTDAHIHTARSYKACLWLSFLLLWFEIAAYYKGWQFGIPDLHLQYLYTLTNPFEFKGFFDWIYSKWVLIRVEYLAPPLQLLANVCIYMFLIESLDRFVLCLGCCWIRFMKIKPIAKQDLESGFFPMVLVQIPMCNEKEVYHQSIEAASTLNWPKSKILIQVLDDSDDPTTQWLIKEEVHKWKYEGVNIVYRHRVIRDGYKAGNLKSAMNCSYVKDYEFVAIFDADFQPSPDFLTRTVAHFKDNEELGLVQARWSFVNKDENLLTRLQYINLAFHFEVEQQVNGTLFKFFGFNGTAGLPESFEAYRKQQHRWHSGPMHLFRLCLPDILKSKMSIWKKGNLIFLFFLLRKLILPFYSFTLFCIILPMTMFVPEATLPLLIICYIPVTVSFLNILPAPKSFPFIVPYLLFENTMSVTKFNAMILGLFQLRNAYERVVTKKSGRSSEGDLMSITEKDQKRSLRGVSEPDLEKKIKEEEMKSYKYNRVYTKELMLAFLLLMACC